MFIELHVENLALIESADLIWQPGLNVLTGETGAGKSMVIDAVSLLLGGRSSQEYIRAGAETCLVQGIFSAPYPLIVLQKLAEFGIISEEEAETEGFLEDLFLSRELQRSGRNVCRINLRQVPLTVFREISRNLINIHGQMEHVVLLEAENQRFLLDSFGGQTHQEALLQTKNAFNLWQEKKRAWQEIQKQEDQQEERQEILQFQQKELEEAQLDVTEEQELQGEYKRLEHAQELAEYAKEAWYLLAGGQLSPLAAVAQSLTAVQRLAALDEALQPLAERLNDIYYNLEDISLELRDYKDRMQEDPERLEAVQERLHQLKSLSKKYGGDVAFLLALKEKIQQELAAWENRDLLLQEKEAEAQKAAAIYEAAAENLHQERLLTAEHLSLAITAELQQLQMPQAKFQVVLEKGVAKAEGFDQVVFMVQPNPGEGLLPVAKIASGGEMSRMMLAIKMILAKLDQVPTLIFDEIDTGLGGIALVSVAEKLKQISHYTQVICVTHAPVLAAYANHNLYVEKMQEGERTITTVSVLNETKKLTEICRMLAGQHITENTKRQAEELITLGKQI